MDRLKLLLTLAALAIFIGACGQAATNSPANNAVAKNTQPSTPAPAATAADTASGKELYAKNCMICHQESGKGGKVTVDRKSLDPPDLTTEKKKAKSDEQLSKYITDGFPDDGMPAFKDKLTPEQIKAIVQHMRTL